MINDGHVENNIETFHKMLRCRRYDDIFP